MPLSGLPALSRIFVPHFVHDFVHDFVHSQYRVVYIQYLGLENRDRITLNCWYTVVLSHYPSAQITAGAASVADSAVVASAGHVAVAPSVARLTACWRQLDMLIGPAGGAAGDREDSCILSTRLSSFVLCLCPLCPGTNCTYAVSAALSNCS